MRRVVVVATALVIAGCAGTTAGPAPTPVATGAVLRDSPAADLVASTAPVTISTLTGETTEAGMADALASSGFLGGRQRSFQGASKDLSLVVSRTLVFRDQAGAERFLGYLHDHAAALFGLTTSSTPMSVPAGAGWAFTAPECACPGAQPTLVGVVRDGATLHWLSINGPQADTARLRSLYLAATTST